MIFYYFENTERPSFFQQKELSRWIKNTAVFYGKRAGNISYVFCTNEHILKINNEFLQHDYYTDIITFDYSEGEVISGELYISLDTVKSNAEKFNESFEKELYRVIIHGILHLCGQNDQTPEEQTEMRRKEDLAIKSFQKEHGME
jgi:rRNA maturation RNase YbeY